MPFQPPLPHPLTQTLPSRRIHGIPTIHPRDLPPFSLLATTVASLLLTLTPGCQSPPSPPNPPPVTARSTSQISPQLPNTRPTPISNPASVPPPTLAPSPVRPNTNNFLPIPTPTPSAATPTIPDPAVARPAPSVPAPARVSPTLTQPPPPITAVAPPSLTQLPVDQRPSPSAPADNPPQPDSPEAALDFLRRALQEQRPDALSHLGRFTLDYCDQPSLLAQAIQTARDQELPLLINLLDRGQQDSRAIEPAFRSLAETIGAGRRESDIIQLIREVAHRECCLRRSYLAATLEGLTVGLDRAGSPPIVSADAIQHLRDFTSQSDLDLAVAAAAASQFFRAPDPTER